MKKIKDSLWKLKILVGFLIEATKCWKGEVWDKNPDSYYCCPGDPMIDCCGCRGASVREVYDPSSWRLP